VFSGLHKSDRHRQFRNHCYALKEYNDSHLLRMADDFFFHRAKRGTLRAQNTGGEMGVREICFVFASSYTMHNMCSNNGKLFACFFLIG